MSIFLNSNNELRSGWKFAAYVVFFLIVAFATGTALNMLGAQDRGDVLEVLAVSDIALLVPAVAAILLTVAFVDHRPFRTFGIGFLPRWQHDLLFGLGVAAGMLAVLIGGCYALGYVRMHWTGGQVSPGALAATFGLLVVGAANEELVFRGLPLQLLIDAIGEWPAMIGMSALFGVMHLGNPNASILGTVNTIVAGILLSLAYVRTRSLWLPFGIHIGWNLGLGFVFGFPLSGIDIGSLWTTGVAGSETILGGDYGPEGGLLGTFIFATAAVIINRHDSIHQDSGSRKRLHSR